MTTLLDLALTAALLSFCVWALVRVWRARHGLDFEHSTPEPVIAAHAATYIDNESYP